MLGTYVVAGIVGLVLLYIIGTYNALVRLRQHVRESWSGIDTELNRRYDLIPNLVETVKGYAKHEREVFQKVTEARSNAISAKLSKFLNYCSNIKITWRCQIHFPVVITVKKLQD